MSGVKISALPAANAANDSDQLEVNQSGTSRRVTVAQIAAQAASIVVGSNVRTFGAVGNGITDDTAAIQAAINSVAGDGGVVLFPAGTYLVNAPVATRVAVDEGAVFQLAVLNSNIVFQGAGKGLSIIKPASNKLEIFAQNGAANITFDGLTFDNSANGVLQNQVAVAYAGPNTGIAGQGNKANAAIRQWEGADLVVRDCSFYSFTIATEYIGTFADNQVLVGDVHITGNTYDGCGQGNLINQPRTIRLTNCVNYRTVTPVNFGGGIDPGHLIYVTDRAGAYPDSITISDCHDIDSPFDGIKVRKGRNVTISNIVITDCGYGLSVSDVINCTVTNIAVKMKGHGESTSQTAIGFRDCGSITLSNWEVDIQGADGFAFQYRTDAPTLEPWMNKGLRLLNGRVTYDYAVDPGKAPIWLEDLSYAEIDNITCYQVGTVASSRYPIYCPGLQNSIIRNCRRLCPDGPPGPGKLVQFDVLSANNVVELDGAKTLWVPGNTSSTTVWDQNGTNKVFRTDGVQIVDWTPVVTFATPGDFVPTYTTQNAWGRRQGDVFHYGFTVTFAANAYTTGTGNVVISGLPFVAAQDLDFWTAQVGTVAAVTIGGTVMWVAGWINRGQSIMTFRSMVSAGGGSSLNSAAIPPSTAAVSIRVSGTYGIVEP